MYALGVSSGLVILTVGAATDDATGEGTVRAMGNINYQDYVTVGFKRGSLWARMSANQRALFASTSYWCCVAYGVTQEYMESWLPPALLGGNLRMFDEHCFVPPPDARRLLRAFRADCSEWDDPLDSSHKKGDNVSDSILDRVREWLFGSSICPSQEV
jgi:hypothetical protein